MGRDALTEGRCPYCGCCDWFDFSTCIQPYRKCMQCHKRDCTPYKCKCIQLIQDKQPYPCNHCKGTEDLEADVSPEGFITKRTDTKEVYSTGAQRSSAAGRGRPQDTSPYAMRRFYQLLERGAEAYGARNYQKGMSMDRTIGSLERHINDYKMHDITEDHLAAIMFNAMVLIDTEERIKLGLAPKELNDYFVSTTKNGTS